VTAERTDLATALRRTASAEAIEDAEIAFISRHNFQAYCTAQPEVALKVLQIVGARLRRLVGVIEELSFTTIRQRLISALVKLAQDEGTKSDPGIEFQGLLDVNARKITVKDMDGLKALLETTS